MIQAIVQGTAVGQVTGTGLSKPDFFEPSANGYFDANDRPETFALDSIFPSQSCNSLCVDERQVTNTRKLSYEYMACLRANRVNR